MRILVDLTWANTLFYPDLTSEEVSNDTSEGEHYTVLSRSNLWRSL